MTSLQRLHLRIKEYSNEYTYLPVNFFISECEDIPDIAEQMEALIALDLIDTASYKTGEIRLTANGRLTHMP